MGRREFLRDALTVATMGLAGCQVLGGGRDVDDKYSPTTEDRLAVAVGHLNTVGLAVSEYQSQAGDAPGEVTFDEERPRERLTTARDAIAAAEETAQDDQQNDIEAVRKYADSVARTVDSVVALIDASDGLERAREILDSEEVDTDQASSTLDDAQTASSQAVTVQDEAKSTLEAADDDRLRALDAAYDAMNGGLDTLAGYVTGVDGLAVGYGKQVSGIDRLQTAQDHVDAEDFDGASDSFSTATDAFDAAATAFTAVISDAADSLVEDLRYGDQQSRSLGSLSLGYVALFDSHDHVSAAETSIEDDAYDDARTSLGNATDATGTAMNRFDEGDTILENEFTSEFDTARDRTNAVQSLAEGYLSILDARDHVTDAESDIEAEEYDSARASLDDASADATTADDEFATGQDTTEDLLSSEFETARTRASGIDSLATGYGFLLDGRDDITAAESQIKNDEDDQARDSLQAASDDTDNADEEFAAGQSDTESVFAGEFQTARDRTTAIGLLSDGSVRLLDAREDITTAESQIEDDEYDQARDSLQAASDDTDKADEEFAAGQSATESVFETEFQNARNRTTAISSLSDGYVTLLDARDHVKDGESSFLDEEYEDARESFATAAEQGQAAETTFQDGAEADDEDSFATEFDRAFQRASAVQSLSSGYATMVDAREMADTGRDHLDNDEFDAAVDQFEKADETLGRAETTFSDGQTDGGDEFDTEYDRALCQVGHLRTAVEHFIAAADAGRNENRSKLETERDAGEEALDEVEDC